MSSWPQSQAEVGPTASELLRGMFHAHSLFTGACVLLLWVSWWSHRRHRDPFLRLWLASWSWRPGAQLLRNSHEHFDLLLSDVRMPGIDGLQLARIALAARPGLPVRFVTGTAAIVEAAGWPTNSVLDKPFTREQLFACIAAALPAELRARWSP